MEVLVYLYYRRQNITVSRGFLIGWQLFAGLLVTIFTITGIAGIDDLFRHGLTTIRPEQISLIPFQWGSINPTGLVMNIILFLPVGLILPLLWQSGTTLIQTAFSGFLLSLLIEISQLFNYRATDIDDLMMNTLGAVIGWFVYRLFLRNCRRFQVNNTGGSFIIRNSAVVHILLFFLFYFCIGGPLINYIFRNFFIL